MTNATDQILLDLRNKLQEDINRSLQHFIDMTAAVSIPPSDVQAHILGTMLWYCSWYAARSSASAEQLAQIFYESVKKERADPPKQASDSPSPSIPAG